MKNLNLKAIIFIAIAIVVSIIKPMYGVAAIFISTFFYNKYNIQLHYSNKKYYTHIKYKYDNTIWAYLVVLLIIFIDGLTISKTSYGLLFLTTCAMLPLFWGIKKALFNRSIVRNYIKVFKKSNFNDYAEFINADKKEKNKRNNTTRKVQYIEVDPNIDYGIPTLSEYITQNSYNFNTAREFIINLQPWFKEVFIENKIRPDLIEEKVDFHSADGYKMDILLQGIGAYIYSKFRYEINEPKWVYSSSVLKDFWYIEDKPEDSRTLYEIVTLTGKNTNERHYSQLSKNANSTEPFKSRNIVLSVWAIDPKSKLEAKAKRLAELQEKEQSIKRIRDYNAKKMAMRTFEVHKDFYKATYENLAWYER